MHDLTQGSIRAHLLRMTAFMLAGMALQAMYSLVDLYWVGRLGREAVAAVGLSGNLMMLVIGLTQVLNVGTVALVSQAAGRKDHAAVQAAFGQAMALSFVAGAVFAAAAWATQDAYVRALASDAQTQALAHDFLVWFIPALALQFPMTALAAALRGIGAMRPGLVAQVGTVLLNIVLAPFLMFGWLTDLPLGIAGAAIATLLAMLAGVAALCAWLGRGRTYLQLALRTWRPARATWGRIVRIGAPAGGEFMLMTVYMVVVYDILQRHGAAAQAAFGIGMRIVQAGFMPALAVSFALAAIVGQNYGAGQAPRVRETLVAGAKMATAWMLAFTALCHVAPTAMIGAFSGDADVIATGGEYLRIISWNNVLFGLIVVAGGLLQGLGNTLPSLLAVAMRLLTFVLPAYWLAQQAAFALSQLWLLSVASVVVQAIVCLWLTKLEAARRLGALVPSGAVETPA